MTTQRQAREKGRRTRTGAPASCTRRGDRVQTGQGQLRDVSIEVTDDQGNSVPFDCFDISAVGIYLHSDLLLIEGEKLMLKLALPSANRPVSVCGEVVRADMGDGFHAPGMGIAFREMGADVREQLRKYVARRFFRHVSR